MVSKACVAYDKFDKRFWSQSDIAATIKVNIYQTCILSSLLNGCEI